MMAGRRAGACPDRATAHYRSRSRFAYTAAADNFCSVTSEWSAILGWLARHSLPLVERLLRPPLGEEE